MAFRVWPRGFLNKRQSVKSKKRSATRLFLEPLESRQLLAVHTWTGNSISPPSTNWSDNANWDIGAPQLGEQNVVLIYPSNPLNATATTSTNDINGLVVESIQFNGLANFGFYQIQGNAFTLTSGITATPGTTFSSSSISNNITLAGNVVVSTNATSTGSVFLSLNGEISGNGALTKMGSGSLSLGGNAANTYTGVTNVLDGFLSLGKPVGTISVPGNLVIDGRNTGGTATVSISNSGPAGEQIANNASVTIRSGTLTLSAYSASLTETVGSLTLSNGEVEGPSTGANTATLALTDALTVDGGTSTIEPIVSLNGTDRTFTVNTGSNLVISGPISDGAASAGFTKAGDGFLILDSGVSNLYRGTTTVTGGALILRSGAAPGGSRLAIPGPLVVGDGSGLDVVFISTSGALSPTTTVTLNDGALLQFDPLTTVNSSSGGLQFNGGRVNTAGGVLTVNGNVTVNANTTNSELSGRVFLNNVTTTFNVGNQGELSVDADLDGAIMPAAGIVKAGPGLLKINGSVGLPGPLVINAGTLEVNGSASATSVTLNAGTLAGSGFVGPITAAGGTVAPGSSPGLLSTEGDLTLSAATTYAVEIEGLSRGDGYDSLDLLGAATLNNATLNATLNFPAPQGATFLILDNDGTDRVVGTFAGLAEGAVLASGLQITYQGGDGNDIVLTRARAQTNTAVGSNAANPVFGQPVTLTATVTLPLNVSGTPTGNVEFREGTTVLGTAPVNTSTGQAVFPGVLLAAGNHAINAFYLGDPGFLGSNSPTPASVNVNRAATQTVLIPNNNPSVVGQDASFVIRVTPVAPGAGVPSGTVTLREGNTNLGAAPLVNGEATINVTTFTAGVHALTAVYSSDVNFQTSTSVAIQQRVDPQAGGVGDDDCFIRALYLDVLNRPADNAGFTFWLGELRRGVGRIAIAQGFLTSVEHFGIIVDQFYQIILDRAADAAGRAGWVSALAGGQSEADVAIRFFISAEYTARHAANADYVRGLYTDILDRAAGAVRADEVAFWQARLDAGNVTRAELARVFLGTSEAFLAAIRDNYVTVLRRTPRAEEVQAFFDTIVRGEIRPTSLTAEFLGSVEYFISVAPGRCAGTI